jgi:hypothetical protein
MIHHIAYRTLAAVYPALDLNHDGLHGLTQGGRDHWFLQGNYLPKTCRLYRRQ